HVHTSTFSCTFLFTPIAPTHLLPLSLHDALPIYTHADSCGRWRSARAALAERRAPHGPEEARCADGVFRLSRQHPRNSRRSKPGDRKSTRLNSSHQIISYAVFCLKKKKKPHKSK